MKTQLAVAVLLMTACGADPKDAAESVKKSADSLNGVEKALHFIGLWPSYSCGDPAPIAAASVADGVRERVACGVVSTESDDTSTSVLLTFPGECQIDGRALSGRARLRFSEGDDRTDARFDLSELKVDGAAIPFAVSVGECGDMMTYSIQGSGTFDHGHAFALDLTTQLRAGIPLIGHDDLVIDGEGELELDHGKDAITFQKVKIEVGDPIPSDGELKIEMEGGHHVDAKFFEGWPVGHADVVIDSGKKAEVPL